MKNIELIQIDKKVYHGKKLWKLHIKGEPDKVYYWKPKDIYERYEFSHDKIVDKIGSFQCKELPNQVKIKIEEAWKLKYASFRFPYIMRKGAKLEIEFSYCFPENEMDSLCINPIRLRKQIIAKLKKKGFTVLFEENKDHELNHLTYFFAKYISGTSGTIKSKIDSVIKLVMTAETEAEREILMDAKKIILLNKI